jgi:Skp family chaperone for outer membrane proteins
MMATTAATADDFARLDTRRRRSAEYLGGRQRELEEELARLQRAAAERAAANEALKDEVDELHEAAAEKKAKVVAAVEM